MTYYLMYYIFSISQREREIHVNILNEDAPKLSWQARYPETYDLKIRH